MWVCWALPELFQTSQVVTSATEVQGKQPGYKSNTKLVIPTQTCLHTEAAWIRRNAFSSGRGGTGMVLGRAEYGGGKQGANLPEEEN